MVNAKELRVDNFVKCKKSNDAGYYRVSEIGGWIRRWDKKKKDESFIDERLIKINGGARDGETYGESDLKPIQLTPEILVACGFRYGKTDGITSFEDSNNDPDGVTHYWDKGIKRTELIDSHNISLVKWGKQEYFTFQLERGFYRQRIKYLHQLQNLYFTLSGEELPYNP